MPTKEEIMKMREENQRGIKERRDRIAAKINDEFEKKQSHNWIQSHHKTGMNGMQPVLSNCRDCGVHYYLFKGNPQFCPQSFKNKETDNE